MLREFTCVYMFILTLIMLTRKFSISYEITTSFIVRL